MSKVRLLLEMTKVMVTAIRNGVCFLYFVGIKEDVGVKDVHADAFVCFDSDDPTYVNGHGVQGAVNDSQLPSGTVSLSSDLPSNYHIW